MMAKLLRLLKQPYPLYLEFSRTFPAIIGCSVFIPVFLLLFQPFDFRSITVAGKNWYVLGYGLPIFFSLSLNFYGLTRLLSGIFREEKWMVGKEILWILWNIFIGGLLCIVYHALTPLASSSFPELFRYLLQSFLIAIIPEIFYVMMTYMAFLKARLRKAERINQKLVSFNMNHHKEYLELISETGKEELNIALNELLFIQSTDNYSNIVWHDRSRLQRKLLRSSLRRLEEQIRYPFVVRCHRSFIVNLAKVRTVDGNARGYRLSLDQYDDPIPVSREMGKPVLEALENISR